MFLNSAKQTIVIAGGGFGGLRATLDLNRAFKKDKALTSKFNLYLIDQNNHHLFTPSLYEIATTLYEDARALKLKQLIAPAFEKIIKPADPMKFYQARVNKIEVERNQIVLGDRTILHYDYLVLALGAETNFYNIAGLKENSYLLKDLISAIALRNGVAKAFEVCLKNKKTLRIVFGGGGVGGVELAGETCGYLKKLTQTHGRRPQVELTIIEGRHEILPGFHPRLVKLARAHLEKLGVVILTGEYIAQADKLKILTRSGKKIPFSVLIWSGGIRPNRLTLGLPFRRDEWGRIGVNKMFCPIFENTTRACANIFVIGDNCCFVKDGRLLSQTAQTAIDEGRQVAKVILAKTKNAPPPDYQPIATRYILPVGGKYAVTDLGFIRLRGWWVWILKELVFLKYLCSIMPWPKAFLHWLRAVNLFVKND